MGLNRSEIKSSELLFSKATHFWIAFFEIFGITDKRAAAFELNFKKLGGLTRLCRFVLAGRAAYGAKVTRQKLDDALEQDVQFELKHQHKHVKLLSII